MTTTRLSRFYNGLGEKTILLGVLAATLLTFAGVVACRPKPKPTPAIVYKLTSEEIEVYTPTLVPTPEPTLTPTPSPTNTPTPPPISLQFFFDEPTTVRFDQLQFLDANGEVIESYGGKLCKGERCGLDLEVPQDAHFLRVIASQIPYREMEWKDLVENSVRVGVRVNKDGVIVITDDGFGPNGIDLTKHIANRPWISYFVLKPEADSDQDGIVNCTKIADRHYRALDPNPRIPEPKPVESKYNLITMYISFGEEDLKQMPRMANLRPLWKNIDGADPDVADKYIKAAVEHGIKTFYHSGGPETPTMEDGLLRARYLPFIKFFLGDDPLWVLKNSPRYNGSFDPRVVKRHFQHRLGILSRNYFDHSQYLKVNDKPAFFLMNLDSWQSEFGSDTALEVVELLYESGEGVGGLWLIGDSLHQLLANRNSPFVSKVDAISHYYAMFGLGKFPYRELIKHTLRASEYCYNLAREKNKVYIPSIIPGFNNIKAYESGLRGDFIVYEYATPEEFREMCKSIKGLMDQQNGDHIIVGHLNEYGESVLGPTEEFGFRYLEIIRDVFCSN